MTPAGKAGPGARLKLQALAAFNNALPLSRAMTDELARNNLFEDWPLEFDIGGERVTVPDLFVVQPGKFSSPKMFQFIQTFGPAAATFLSAHRISLFRVGVLVQSVRGAATGAAMVQ